MPDASEVPMSRFAMLPPLLFSLALGCSGGDSKDGTGTDGTGPTASTGDDDDNDDDDDTSYSSTSTVVIDAQLLVTGAAFGYDDATGMVVPYIDPQAGPQPITFTVIIGDSSMQYDPNGPTPYNSCRVDFTTTTPQPVSSFMASFDDVWWGIEVPANADVSSDCGLVELPADFGGDPVPHVTKWSWGVGIGELDPAVAQQIEARLSPADWQLYEPLLLGSGGWSDFFENLINDEGVLLGSGQAYEADDDFAFVLDRAGYTVEMEADWVWDGKAPARAIYVVGSQPMGPATLLTR